jgi:uncharacterized protein (DUF4213/DUF364 family)
MAILQETAQLVRQKLGSDFEKLTIERIAVGLFFTGAKLSNGAGGVSYTPVKDIPQAVCCPSSAGRIFDPVKIKGMKAADVLAALPSDEPIKAAIAIATLNALSATCWERGLNDNYRIQMNTDAVDVVRMPAENSVARRLCSHPEEIEDPRRPVVGHRTGSPDAQKRRNGSLYPR